MGRIEKAFTTKLDKNSSLLLSVREMLEAKESPGKSAGLLSPVKSSDTKPPGGRAAASDR